jgi:signal transduction histidine kinase
MKWLRSTSVRAAALYTAFFAAAVVVLGVVTILATRSALERELDSRIQSEALALAQEDRTEGLAGVVQAVRERDRTPGALEYGLLGPDGRSMAGRLAPASLPTGWSTLRVRETHDADNIRVLTIALSGGHRLLVGADLERISILDGAVMRAFGFAFLGVLLLGAAGGFALSRAVQRRYAEMSAAAHGIIDGDLARRIPVSGAGDDLDGLAATFNLMLDRIAALMDSLRQVSSDVAHDLRTPLTRLRQRLEGALATGDVEARTAAMEGALIDLDAILDTFAALLRIAQIEGGARRAAFRPVDLAAVAAAVVEAFSPSAEEGQRSLRLERRATPVVEGDRELLTQMLVNLVENALAHTPPGSDVRVVVGETRGRPRLEVNDNGPGVPAEARETVFDRFVRLERSRSTPGNGLGLALVAAVARLHGASVELRDASPGLAAVVAFGRPHGA